MGGSENWTDLLEWSQKDLKELIHQSSGGVWVQGQVCQSTANKVFPKAPSEEAALRALSDIQAAAWNLVAAKVAKDVGTGGEESYRSIARGLLSNMPSWTGLPRPKVDPGSCMLRALFLLLLE